MAGLHYIHEKSIIHNDIKEDNVVIDMADGEFNAIIIDFGKASLDGQGKKYTLTDSDRKLYKTRHPHIAPDLRDGLTNQDKYSDVYSAGRLLLILIEKKVLVNPAIYKLANLCTTYSTIERPSSNDLYTSIINVFLR